MSTISITKRTNGGFTIVTDTDTVQVSRMQYVGVSGGVLLITDTLTQKIYFPSEWTIQAVTGFTTAIQVCDALDALGISGDSVDDIKTLVGTIDADTGNISTKTDLIKTAVDAIKTAVEKIDDFISGNEGQVDVITLPATPAGTNLIGKVGIDQATANANEVVVKSGAVTAAQSTAANLNMTEASAATILARAKEIAGQDFLCITDATEHTGLDCTMIYVMNDAVFTSITVAGSSVAAKGLTAITVVAGTMLPFGKVHATAIQLASGKVIAYIN